MDRLLIISIVALLACQPEPEPIFHSSMMIGSWIVTGYKNDHGWHKYKERDYQHITTEIVFSSKRVDWYKYGTWDRSRGGWTNG